MLTALLVAVLARRSFSPETLEKGSGLIGNLLAIVGTFYGVLLGLIVVDSLTRFENTILTVQSESNCLADIFLLSERLPEPHCGRVKDLCRRYALEVVTHEWPLMAEGHVSMEARKTAVSLFRSLHDFDPGTEAEKAVYPIILQLITQVWDNRRQRAHAVEFGIPTVEWVALILGSVVTIVLIGMYFVESQRLQLVAIGLATFVIAMNLYLVVLFSRPFAGEMCVSNRPFAIDIDIFDGMYDSVPSHDAEKATSND